MLYVCTYQTSGYAKLWFLKHYTGDSVLTYPIGFLPYRVFAADYLPPPIAAVVIGSRTVSAPVYTSGYMKTPCAVHDMPTWDSYVAGRVFSDPVSLLTGNPSPKLCDNTPVYTGRVTYRSGIEDSMAEVEWGDRFRLSLSYTQTIRRVDRFCTSVCQTAGERARSYCLTNVRIVHSHRRSNVVVHPDFYVSAGRAGSPYSIADNQLKLLARRPRITSKSYLPLRFARSKRRYYNTLPFVLDHIFSRRLFKHIVDQIHRVDRSAQIHGETQGSCRSIREVSGIDYKQVKVKSRVIIPQQAARLRRNTPIPVGRRHVVQLNRLSNHVSTSPRAEVTRLNRYSVVLQAGSVRRSNTSCARSCNLTSVHRRQLSVWLLPALQFDPAESVLGKPIDQLSLGNARDNIWLLRYKNFNVNSKLLHTTGQQQVDVVGKRVRCNTQYKLEKTANFACYTCTSQLDGDAKYIKLIRQFELSRYKTTDKLVQLIDQAIFSKFDRSVASTFCQFQLGNQAKHTSKTVYTALDRLNNSIQPVRQHRLNIVTHLAQLVRYGATGKTARVIEQQYKVELEKTTRQTKLTRATRLAKTDKPVYMSCRFSLNKVKQIISAIPTWVANKTTRSIRQQCKVELEKVAKPIQSIYQFQLNRVEKPIELFVKWTDLDIAPTPAQLIDQFRFDTSAIQAYRPVEMEVFDSAAHDTGLLAGRKLNKAPGTVDILSSCIKLTHLARPALRLCINSYGFTKTSRRLTKIDTSAVSGHQRSADPVNSTPFVRSKQKGIKQYSVAARKSGGKVDLARRTISSKRVSREIASACVTGVTWDEIFDWYRDYGPKVDRLQLPTVDFVYDLSKLYNPNTGLPYNPLSPIDRNEVRVEFPGTHPVGKYADVGLKIVGVHLWVLRDIILLLYRDRKEHGLQYEQMSGGDAVRLALDRLYNNLRFMDYKYEEYMRAFRHARWYGEYVIVNTSEYWLIRSYDSWISGEGSYNIVDGLPADDRKYIARAENWGINTSLPFDRRTYTTSGRQALIEFKVTNYCRSTLGFTMEVFDQSGSLQLRFYVDGKDKSYLLVPFGRVEATFTPGEHSILFEFEGGSDDDRVEINAISVDNVIFRSAEVVERPGNANGAEALDMLIDMLMRYYELHHTGKNKGTRLYRLPRENPSPLGVG